MPCSKFRGDDGTAVGHIALRKLPWADSEKTAIESHVVHGALVECETGKHICRVPTSFILESL